MNRATSFRRFRIRHVFTLLVMLLPMIGFTPHAQAQNQEAELSEVRSFVNLEQWDQLIEYLSTHRLPSPMDADTIELIDAAYSQVRAADGNLFVQFNGILLDQAPRSPFGVILLVDRAEQHLNQARAMLSALFYEFGLPSTDQAQNYLTHTTAAMKQLEAAENLWHNQQMALPRGNNFMRIQAIGLWDKLRGYTTLQMPFFRATAAFEVALQPDDGPWYAHAEEQAKAKGLPYTIKAERRRLLETADFDAQSLTEDPMVVDALPPQTLIGLYSLHGRIKTHLEQYNPAMELLDKAIAMRESIQPGADEQTPMPEVIFTAHLGKVNAFRQLKKYVEARALVDQLAQDPLPNQNLWYKLILVDQNHLMLKIQGADLNEIYQPYEDLMNDPELGEFRQAVQNLVTDRLAATVDEDANLNELPAMLAVSVGISALREGDAASQAGNEQLAQANWQRAVDSLNALKEENLSNTTAAMAIYNLGLANYRLGNRAIANENFMKLANEYDDLPLGEEGMVAATELAWVVYNETDQQDNEALAEAADRLEKTLRLLIEKYPNTDSAKQEIYRLGQLLEIQERYSEALEMYERVPRTHPNYFDAQYSLMSVRYDQWQQGNPATKESLAGDLEAGIRSFQSALPDARSAAQQIQDPAERQQRLNQIKADEALSVVALADVEVEVNENGEKAARDLANFEARFPEPFLEAMVSQARRIRIRALQQAGDYTQAAQQVDVLIEENPEVAGGVVSELLRATNSEARYAREIENNPEKARELAESAVLIATKLNEWADTPTDDGEARLEPGERMSVALEMPEAMISAGQYDAALAELQRIEQAYEQAASTTRYILMLGEAHYQSGNYDTAMAEFQKLIDDQGIASKKGPVYWRSWMRILQSVDAKVTAEGKTDPNVFFAIQRLEKEDPLLGGSEFSPIFESLRAKHAP